MHQGLVPGTGVRSPKASDDIEDPKWAYNFNLPKSSHENDDQQRLPAGGSANGKWFEGVKRGQPDVIERVPTPPGGLAGSQGALLLRSKNTGVPGRFSGTNQQDDLIVNVAGREGSISVARSPSIVVRVYLPPFDEWEQRSGPTFGFRAACQAYHTKRVGRRMTSGMEPYWPGMFFHFVKGDGKKTQDSARMIIRGGPQGNDFAGPQITEPGWWTLGLSVTPDGQVHYYAHAGVDDLTAQGPPVEPVSVWLPCRAARHVLLRHHQRRQRQLVDRVDHRRSVVVLPALGATSAVLGENKKRRRRDFAVAFMLPISNESNSFNRVPRRVVAARPRPPARSAPCRPKRASTALAPPASPTRMAKSSRS